MGDKINENQDQIIPAENVPSETGEVLPIQESQEITEKQESEVEKELSEQEIEKIKKILAWVKERQPKEYRDNYNRKEAENLGYSFLNDLLRSISGHSGLSYRFRGDVDHLEDFRDSSHGEDRYDPKRIQPEMIEFLKSKFQKNLIIDLGYGYRSLGYAASNVLEAGGYVGVEINSAKGADKSCKDFKGEVPFVIAQEDMGRFLKDFQENGYSTKVVLFCGIDKYSYARGTSYTDLIERINNALDADGIVIIAGNFFYTEKEYGKELEKYFKEIKGDWRELFNVVFYAKK